MTLRPHLLWQRLAVVMAVAMIAAVAVALRTVRLEDRPVHPDEANQAWKLGELLETGAYRYDPHDHHGPALYYLAWPLVRLQSGGVFAASAMAFYRLTPALFGVALAMMALAAARPLGPTEALAAAALTALSPAMVAYSRFFIHEMLLVAFTFGLLLSVWRHAVAPTWRSAAAAGLSLGLMQSTKETWLVAVAALALAVAATVPPRELRRHLAAHVGHILLGLGVAAAVSLLFYSSFGTNPRGPLDAWTAYATYLGRGVAADATAHRHPVGWYLGLLIGRPAGVGVRGGEVLILLLGLTGLLAAWRRPVVPGAAAVARRALGLFAVVLTAAYSLLPYKTPWCLLSFWHAWILLAGIGAAILLETLPRPLPRLLAGLLLAAGALGLGRDAWLAATRDAAHPRHPYAYAQTSRAFLDLVRRLEELRQATPAGEALTVFIMAPAEDTWPLPWYLRHHTHAGWWTDLDPAAVQAHPAVLVTTPELAQGLPADWNDNYLQEYHGQRPGVLLVASIRRDHWARWLARHAQGTARTAPDSPQAEGPW